MMINGGSSSRRRISVLASSLSASWFALLPFLLLICSVGANHGVFSVKCKYAGQDRSLSVLKAHDYRRQLSLLAGVDLPLGGSGRPDAVGSAPSPLPNFETQLFYFLINFIIID